MLIFNLVIWCCSFVCLEHHCECPMKNNQTTNNDEVELANNPVRDLSSVETFAKRNTACRRYATIQVEGLRKKH